MGRRGEALASEHFKLIFRRPTQRHRVLPAVSVAKSLDKRATARNYMRRVIREALRKRPRQFNPGLVVVVRKAFKRGEAVACQQELVELLERQPCES